MLGEDVFNSYYKFSIVRNPWDKMVSRYCWAKATRRKDGEKTFKEHLLSHKISNGDLMMPYISVDGKVITDRIIRYENINEDLKLVCDDLGLEYDLSYMVKSKSNLRPKETHYREYYDDETREIVARKYKNEIKYFGYTF
jgi:hypothetical protein